MVLAYLGSQVTIKQDKQDLERILSDWPSDNKRGSLMDWLLCRVANLELHSDYWWNEVEKSWSSGSPKTTPRDSLSSHF